MRTTKDRIAIHARLSATRHGRLSMQVDDAIAAVREFHVERDSPRGVLLQRAAMAIEELAEWLRAHAGGELANDTDHLPVWSGSATATQPKARRPMNSSHWNGSVLLLPLCRSEAAEPKGDTGSTAVAATGSSFSSTLAPPQLPFRWRWSPNTCLLDMGLHSLLKPADADNRDNGQRQRGQRHEDGN